MISKDYYLSRSERRKSFRYIEDFIEREVTSWNSPPDTDSLTKKFSTELKKLNKKQFAFLLMHSGFIPEFYSHDSSQETLYSKLLEVLVCEWALRIGFEDSHLQKQKASKEDVTIKSNGSVVVCDAKGFRLGRSQSAPNVKDVIKKADYRKWLSAYDENVRKGGLITFPSLHSWKTSSDVFSYCSDKDIPILFMYYEHMSFYLLADLDDQHFVDFLDDYDSVHPDQTKKVSEYFERIEDNLFEGNEVLWEKYKRMSEVILREKVLFIIEEIKCHLLKDEKRIRDDLKKLDKEDLVEKLVTTQNKLVNGQLIKNLVNVKKFRLS